ncbi:MAG: phosphoenolpyruvate--protein phosphotransferase [Candidatus Odinarchaeota archaeon]|nr:phosphoenolpyruvate--protein phosphotransferase [Candidatus Odinarchaeota archaeon]
MLKGIPASPGIAIGRAYIYKKEIVVAERKIEEGQVEEELKRFRVALEASRRQLLRIKEKTSRELGENEAEIFQAQLMMLEDPMFVNEVENKIRCGKNAEAAVNEVVENLVSAFSAIKDEYLKERALDIQDVGERVIKNLLGYEGSPELAQKAVVIAKDLTPSDTACMNIKRVLGFATEVGGTTSHTAIIARQHGIPAVVGVANLTEKVKPGELVIIDGNKGLVIIRPNKKTLSQYIKISREITRRSEELKKFISLPSVTADGYRIEVVANIGNLNEVKLALTYGAEGIGLLRTEFLYLDRTRPPSEEEQFKVYSQIAQSLGKKPVIVRTLDVGGDKPLPFLKMPKELNPFLGWRGIRISLEEPDIFKEQLRAILKASVYGNLKIMFPMISTLEEVKTAKNILNEAKEELRSRSIPFKEDIEVGIMIETPSAALMADALAREVDFFSIGTNDLTQYTLAVDRTNQKISSLYDALHPAVIRLINNTVKAAHKRGRWTGICGELASDPEAVPILIGLSLDELSANPPSIPNVKKLIRSISYEEAKQLAKKAIKMTNAKEVRNLVKAFIQSTGKH